MEHSPEEYIAPLHVVLISSGRIPATTYGGTERVVEWLARGLAECGHTVTVLAPRGSTSRFAHVVGIDLPTEALRHWDARPFLPPGTDLVHAHFPWHAPADLPSCWTLHGNARTGEQLPPGAIALSQHHATRHQLARWVHNGLDPADYRFAPSKQPFDLFLGRLHSVKGWRWAVRGARQSGQPLVVAGGWRPSWRRTLRFVGKVGGEQKVALLAGAAALWMPVQWDEPFGLTAIEAMVSGTPVLGTRRGALPEIVAPEGGILVDTLDELVAARPLLAALDAETIRAGVLARFTHRTMAAGYEQIYRTLR